MLSFRIDLEKKKTFTRMVLSIQSRRIIHEISPFEWVRGRRPRVNIRTHTRQAVKKERCGRDNAGDLLRRLFNTPLVLFCNL